MASLDALVGALSSSDPTTRQRAAMGLGATDATAVMPALVRAMATEPDPFVRETLVWAVVARPDAAAPELVAALDLPGLPREPILHALSKIAAPSTFDAVRRHADDPDATVAAKAWWAMARIAPAQATGLLVGRLGAADAERRHGLTRALLQVGEPAVDPLAEALAKADPAARSHAAEVLVVLADPSRYSALERRAGRDHSARAADILLGSTAPEVDGALLLATISDDRPGLVATATRLREQRARG